MASNGLYSTYNTSITRTNRKEEEEARGIEVEVFTINLQEDRTEVLQEEINEVNDTKPATEGRGVPYETEVNKARGSTYHLPNQQHSRHSQPYSRNCNITHKVNSEVNVPSLSLF